MATIFTNSSNETVIWQPEPPIRGTFTLLSTCLLTLILCVWSAIHLNLPGETSSAKRKLRLFLWVLCGLLVPEYLVMTAWTQHEVARRLAREAEEVFREADTQGQGHQEAVREGKKRNPWTLTHSFWAAMGGFTVDLSLSERFVPASHRPTLTAMGVALLMRCEPDLVPDMSETDIKDKSKGNSFTKFIASTQALWFCAACIARLAQHLPISQLELNTFAHAVCTILIYGLWWRKPLDIETSFPITDERIHPLLAYMWMSSRTSAVEHHRTFPPGTTYSIGQSPEFEAINLQPHRGLAPYTSGRQFFTRNPDRTQPKIRVTPTESLEGTDFYVNYDSTRWVVEEHQHTTVGSFTYTNTTTRREPPQFDLAPADVRRWKLARQAMDKCGLEKPSDDLCLVTIEPVPEVHYGWTSIFPDTGQDGASWAIAGFLALGVAYGGVHVLAWDAKFPDELQQSLWHWSTIAIAGLSVVILLLRTVAHLPRFLLRRPVRADTEDNGQMSHPPPPNLPRHVQDYDPAARTGTRKTDTPLFKRLVRVVLVGISFVLLRFLALAVVWCGIAYTAARCYVVIESFRTVFYLPPGAYVVTKWSQYVPHIT